MDERARGLSARSMGQTPDDEVQARQRRGRDVVPGRARIQVDQCCLGRAIGRDAVEQTRAPSG